MSYAPLWPEWVTQTREALAAHNAGVSETRRIALQDLGAYIGEELRMEFPDVEATLIGLIALRTASHLGGLIADAPDGVDLESATCVTIGLMAGDHLVGAR
ncbi:hypothetical protein FHS43_006224 [Streptosporangium becharense]|uniref:Uncharacterized protein n=1 Tax=Streptosporangium becharense TaxID=1816182 RepID=A0A7W9IGD7_9ACTN|nr:hypothetical protein [Streptosporangium becharense]MBB2914912.1 hypothetical protein [Streptosporangium becharense]MBB5820277.1 hypothetical protein [Streptosporangium becharense]